MAAALESAVEPFPEPMREAIPVNALVPDIDPDTAAARAAEAVAEGFRTIKLKVGDDDDLQRVAAVRDAIGDDVALRLDANGLWDIDTAMRRIRALASRNPEYVEEPVHGLAALAEVRGRSPVPIAADESVRSLDDARRIAWSGAADVLIVKVQACGGVTAAMQWIEAAQVPTVVTSMIESSVGLAAGVALAAAVPDLPYACGLGTGSLLAGDVVVNRLVPLKGSLEVRRPVPDPELLDRYGLEEDEE